jgi:hypothetical protein
MEPDNRIAPGTPPTFHENFIMVLQLIILKIMPLKLTPAVIAAKFFLAVDTAGNHRNLDRLACRDKAETVVSRALSENWARGKASHYSSLHPLFLSS